MKSSDEIQSFARLVLPNLYGFSNMRLPTVHAVARQANVHYNWLY